ncbi:hypothetical protein QVD17_17149 [Tagetes erecta]|uniref:Uncharacterized protein n=1 Tax=Tagetes erecta TaxID=13708 RepID=A0AAD8KSK7_TARER|nr:hypothetical protein QVD17_17149 [Tagetes erecta]
MTRGSGGEERRRGGKEGSRGRGWLLVVEMGEGEEVGNEDGARRRGRQRRQEPSLLRRERDEKDEEDVKRDPLLLP